MIADSSVCESQSVNYLQYLKKYKTKIHNKIVYGVYIPTPTRLTAVENWRPTSWYFEIHSPYRLGDLGITKFVFYRPAGLWSLKVK